jgi:endonuclease III
VKPADREAFFSRLAALEPTPKTELNWSTPFELLVAVLLSAQSTDVGVNKVTATLFRRANTAQAIVDLGLEELSEALRTLGLYRNKARHLLQTCEILLRDHGGVVPSDRASLEALPGVGRKTANVVLNTAFGEPTIAVDTHIFRVSNRTGLAPGKTPLAVELQLLKRVPSQYRQHAHHWLILHGRYICKARKPLCEQCPVDDLCKARKAELRRQASSPTERLVKSS